MDEQPKEATDDKALLAEAKANYKIASEWWEENRKSWLSAQKFRNGDQWPEAIRKQREADGLPCLVVDKTDQYVKQVVNDSRQNRPGVKVHPVDDKGDIEVAEGIQGLIRQIWSKSKADTACDTAVEHAAGCGFGFIRLVSEYAHANTFHHELVVKRVRNPLSIKLAPHEEADGSDAEYGFCEMLVPKARFKKLWPKAKETNWETDAFAEGWADEESVKVCEYYYKVEEPRTLHLLETGDVVEDEEYQRRKTETGEEQPPIIESREIPVVKVKWCRMTGGEILEKKEWFGKYVPIFPVYGDELDIEGKVVLKGMVQKARDAQMLHNFSRSAFAQRVALTPAAPWMMAEGQDEGYEKEWANANKASTTVLHYKTVDVQGNPVPPPQRISPTDIPAGYAQDAQMSEHDIQGSLGVYNASLGQQGNEKSGKAIMARQREGDTATFHYPDNLSRTIRHLGRAIVDAAPKVYDGTRLIRMLGEDGATSEAQVDPRQGVPVRKIKQNGKELAIFNFNIGVYDADISTGANYTTKRIESAEAMIELSRANPTMWQTHGDLIVGAQDWPNAEAFAKRSKLMLPPEIRQAIEAEDASEDPEVAAMRAQMQQLEQEAQQAIQEREAMLMEAQKKIEELQKQDELKAQELQLKGEENQIKMFDAETKRLQVQASAMEARQSTVDEAVSTSLGETENIVAQERNSTSEAIHAMLTGINGLTGAVERVAGAVEVVQGQVGMVQDQMDMVQGQVQELADEAAAPIAYGRDEQGRVSSVTKGKRTRTVKRGPDGKVAGVQ